jgi:hypothetical protein
MMMTEVNRAKSKPRWNIEIRPYTENEFDKGFRKMKAHNEREANRIARGALINLNHERYYVKVYSR